jgi:MerR family transcriptional regulator, light-induced transcriptional regulator
MASVFGFAEIKSRIDGWRAGLSGVTLRRSATGNSALPLTDVESDADRAPSDDFAGNAGGQYDLSLLLENVVIPRLISQRGPVRAPIRPAIAIAETVPLEPSITAAEVEQFADLAVADDAPTLLDFVERAMASGRSVETIYVELLAPAARRLGVYWEEDQRDFVDVTMGLWRIQEILRELALRVPPQARPGQGERSALFATMPGEQHSFGTLMVSDCFERAGWGCEVLIEPTTSDLTGKLARRHYDLVGLTVSCDCSSAALAGLISALRAVSTNPGVRIMVGGRFINERPELLAECGADATASDAPSAVALADYLVPAKTSVFDTPI